MITIKGLKQHKHNTTKRMSNKDRIKVTDGRHIVSKVTDGRHIVSKITDGRHILPKITDGRHILNQVPRKSKQSLFPTGQPHVTHAKSGMRRARQGNK